MNQPRSRRPMRYLAAVTIALAATLLVPSPAQAAGQRPQFQMPFRCGQVWEASTYNGHKPNENSIDLGMWAYQDIGPFTFYVNVSGGQPVLASAAGTVSEVGTWDGTTTPSLGNYIFIDHGNGWVTWYVHLMDAPSVVVGQAIAAGQRIGRVGNTGTVDFHLHYTQLQDGVAVRVQFNGADINTYSGNLSPWGNGERLTSANCGGRNIIAQHSNKCLTAPADNTADGVQITQATCGTAWNQMWTFVYLGMGHYRIQSLNNGKCLDVAGGILAHATAVVQNTCAWVSSQSWLIGRQPNTDQNTWWDYRVTSTLCLDVGWASQDDGAGLLIGNCWAGSNQIFRTVSVAGPPN
jgi:hypothetical protein